MEFVYIITLAAFLVCFLAALVGLRLAASELSSPVPGSSWRCDAFLPVLLVSFAAFVLLFAFANRTYDQIFPLTWVDLLLAFVSAAAVYAVSLFKKTGRFALPALAGAVLLCTAFLPADFMLFQNHLPFWGDRFCIVLLWTLFAWCFRYMNGIDGIASLQASGFVCGLLILSVLGGLPLLYGNFAAALLGALTALLVYNWYPAKLLLKDGACVSLGFLLGWLTILTAREGTGSCALIYAMYYILEICWAVGRKLIANDGSLVSNTLYYRLNASGLSPAEIGQNVAKLLTVLLVLGSFQVYAPNNYSLPLAAALVALWFMSKLNNWQEPQQSLKDINREVIRDIKDNVEDIKKIIR